MATDSTEPRTGLIVRLGALALVTLLVVHAGLTGYFDRMAKAEAQRKLGSPDALMSQRADDKARLAAGSMPIDKAMQMLTEKGRMGAGAAISPTASKDVAPLQGWSKMPGEVPAAMTAPPPPPPEAVVDAGTLAANAGRPDGGPAGNPKGAPGGHTNHK
jgi:hypothetical protein